MKNTLIAFMLLWCQYTRAQSATFYGYVDGVDSLQVIFWNDYVMTTYGAKEFTVTPGYFTFTLPGLSKPGKLYFKLSDQGSSMIMNDVIVAPGDSIFMIAKRDDMANFSFTFSGKGQEKYHCKQELDKVYEAMDLQRFIYGKQHAKDYLDKQNMPLITQLYNDAEIAMNQTLDKYNTGVNSYLKADIQGQFRTYHDHAMGLFYLKSDSAAAAYKRYSQPLDTITEDQLRLSRNYINCILSKETLDLYYQNGGRQINFQDMYHHLKQQYTGTVREWLLFNWITSEGGFGINLVNNNDQVQFDQCVNDACKLIKQPTMRGILRSRLDTHVGAPVYNFALKDTAGRTITLESLKGNVVLIDVWSTGCLPCSYFYKTMEKEVLPALSNANDLKIVSISMDATTERWKKSISSGLYTNNKNINLRFNTSDNDPFVEHYKIAAIPFVMLVDRQGHLIQKINTPTLLGKDELKELLQKALN